MSQNAWVIYVWICDDIPLSAVLETSSAQDKINLKNKIRALGDMEPEAEKPLVTSHPNPPREPGHPQSLAGKPRLFPPSCPLLTGPRRTSIGPHWAGALGHSTFTEVG